MAFEAFWVSPSGKILGVDSRHINYVYEHPKTFGTTEDEIKKIYKKHKEKLGQEGNAREEIMVDLIKKGWIRVRKQRNAWIVQAYNLTRKTSENIWNWVKDGFMNDYLSKNTEINIATLKDGDLLTSSTAKLLSGKLLGEEVLKRQIKRTIKEVIKDESKPKKR